MENIKIIYIILYRILYCIEYYFHCNFRIYTLKDAQRENPQIRTRSSYYLLLLVIMNASGISLKIKYVFIIISYHLFLLLKHFKFVGLRGDLDYWSSSKLPLGETLDRSPVHLRATQRQQPTHLWGRTYKPGTEIPQPGFKPGTLLL